MTLFGHRNSIQTAVAKFVALKWSFEDWSLSQPKSCLHGGRIGIPFHSRGKSTAWKLQKQPRPQPLKILKNFAAASCCRLPQRWQSPVNPMLPGAFLTSRVSPSAGSLDSRITAKSRIWLECVNPNIGEDMVLQCAKCRLKCLDVNRLIKIPASAAFLPTKMQGNVA